MANNEEVRDGSGTSPQMHPGLASRLAAAVDGHRDGRDLYFMARLEPDEHGCFELDGPFLLEQLGRLRVPDGHGIFGPYPTQAPTEDISRTPIKSITIELHNGETRSFDASRLDALFWSLSSLEKFVAPYHANASGMQQAQDLLKDFLDTDVYLIAHDARGETTLVELSPESPGTLQSFPVRNRANKPPRG